MPYPENEISISVDHGGGRFTRRISQEEHFEDVNEIRQHLYRMVDKLTFDIETEESNKGVRIAEMELRRNKACPKT